MTIYCVRCQRKTGDVRPHRVTMRNGRPAMAANCAVCGAKKFQFLPMHGHRAPARRGSKSAAHPVRRSTRARRASSRYAGSGIRRMNLSDSRSFPDDEYY